ncbi:hypothetical protein EVAR_28754_1 [Eumeta japonica]|uniref:Uncharacterized protein n=1 Tax=Eumeta variegata TaxID=151549 RepID=A0A4C1Z4Y0_EUMVA|nr:hypothetical protein EVAR_28754_1 [Eumeta japonica]
MLSVVPLQRVAGTHMTMESSEQFSKFSAVVEELKNEGELFERFGTDHYLGSLGLFVLPEFRGRGIAQNMLKARSPAGALVGRTVEEVTHSRLYKPCQCSGDCLCRGDLLEIPHEASHAPPTPPCVVRPRTVKLNRKPADSIADPAMAPSAGLFSGLRPHTTRAGMKRSTHQFSSPPLLEPAPNAEDGDDSSWPRSGLIIITRGVIVMGKQGFPRRTVEDKTHGASSDVGSQDGECS